MIFLKFICGILFLISISINMYDLILSYRNKEAKNIISNIFDVLFRLVFIAWLVMLEFIIVMDLYP